MPERYSGPESIHRECDGEQPGVSGTSNLVNISSVNGVTGYPASFTVVQYSALVGNHELWHRRDPNESTGGYVSNDVTHSRIVLVLTNGPAVLTWTAGDSVNPTFWDGSRLTGLRSKVQ